MRINFGKLIAYISANIGEIKQVADDVRQWTADGSDVFNAIVALWQKFNTDERPVMGVAGDHPELTFVDLATVEQLAKDHPALVQMAISCVEVDDCESVTTMQGPAAVLQVAKLLIQYGPVILEMIKAIRDQRRA